MSDILNEVELGTLKEMAVYWREVFKRDDADAWKRIMGAELGQVIYLLEAEKVLRIVNAYVNRVIDEETT